VWVHPWATGIEEQLALDLPRHIGAMLDELPPQRRAAVGVAGEAEAGTKS